MDLHAICDIRCFTAINPVTCIPKMLNDTRMVHDSSCDCSFAHSRATSDGYMFLDLGCFKDFANSILDEFIAIIYQEQAVETGPDWKGEFCGRWELLST